MASYSGVLKPQRANLNEFIKHRRKKRQGLDTDFASVREALSMPQPQLSPPSRSEGAPQGLSTDQPMQQEFTRPPRATDAYGGAGRPREKEAKQRTMGF